MQKRIAATLLALALVLSLVPAALAAGRATLHCEVDGAGRGTLSLEGLTGGIYAVQLEFTLRGEYPDCVFTPASRTAYAPDCTVYVFRGETRVTVYLTSRSALDRNGYLELGELYTGAPAEDWPDTVRVTLLDKELHMMPGAAGTDIPAAVSGGGGSLPQRPQRPQNPGTPEEPEDPVLPPETALPFSDVRPGDWFYDAVCYVYSKGIMQGVTGTTFDPYATTNRAMIVTILHRLDGSPAALPAAFGDVEPEQYYAGPVAWASANGIVNGYSSGVFRPELPITREHLAAILYRYAGYKGLDVSLQGDLSAFPDANTVSGYAAGAMRWAVGTGLINGVDGRLDPGGSASRAQVAVIFHRLCAYLLGQP